MASSIATRVAQAMIRTLKTSACSKRERAAASGRRGQPVAQRVIPGEKGALGRLPLQQEEQLVAGAVARGGRSSSPRSR